MNLGKMRGVIILVKDALLDIFVFHFAFTAYCLRSSMRPSVLESSRTTTTASSPESSYSSCPGLHDSPVGADVVQFCAELLNFCHVHLLVVMPALGEKQTFEAVGGGLHCAKVLTRPSCSNENNSVMDSVLQGLRLLLSFVRDAEVGRENRFFDTPGAEEEIVVIARHYGTLGAE